VKSHCAAQLCSADDRVLVIVDDNLPAHDDDDQHGNKTAWADDSVHFLEHRRRTKVPV
jgi:hypothetical protein